MDYEEHRKNLEKHSKSTARAAQVSAVAQVASAVAQAASAAAQTSAAAAQMKSAEAAERTAEANELVAASTLSKLQFERDVMWLEKSDEQGKFDFFVPRVKLQVISSRAVELIESILVGIAFPSQDIAALASTQSELDSAQSQLYADSTELRRLSLTPDQVVMDNNRNDGVYGLSITYGQFWKEMGTVFKVFVYLIAVLVFLVSRIFMSSDISSTSLIASMIFVSTPFFLIFHWRLLWVFGRIDRINESKLAAMQLRSSINALGDKVNERSKHLGRQLQVYKSKFAPYFDSLSQEFERRYEDDQTASAMKDAIKVAEQGYPSTCRIKQYPTSTGMKDEIRDRTIRGAYSQLIAKAGLSRWNKWMSREAKICGNCGRLIESGSNFCRECGRSRVTYCAKCALPLPDDANFCDSCGTHVRNLA